MQEKLKFDQVTAKALKFIKEILELMYSTIQHYKIGGSILKVFMESSKIDFLSTGVCQQFISSLTEIQQNTELLQFLSF